MAALDVTLDSPSLSGDNPQSRESEDVRAEDAPPAISVVIPCLNEERTVTACIEEAWEGIARSGLTGEVIIADNGSIDRSRERAEAAGARVIPVPKRGYGSALQTGFLAARGNLLVMGDADMSYDFRFIPDLVAEQQRTGADMVVGDRFAGGIEPGAMPLSHRLIGNPGISATIRLLFGAPVPDCYCGLRLITRDAHRRLPIRATGMEYALEMIVLGQLARFKFSHVPVTLRVDGRDRRPHLKTLRDGYSSFRFLFQHATITMYVVPGGLLMLGGALALIRAVYSEIAQKQAADSVWADWGALAVLAGWHMILLGMIARMFAAGFLGSRVDPALRRFFGKFRFEHGMAAAALLTSIGFGAAAYGADSPIFRTITLVCLVTACSAFFGTFVASLIGRAIPDDRFVEPKKSKSGKTVSETKMAPATADTGQNEIHSLATQEAMAEGIRYNRWIVDSISPALDSCRRVLDVGCSLGNITEVAAERLGNTPETKDAQRPYVVGVEIIPQAVAAFQQRFSGRDDLTAVQGDILQPSQQLLDLGPFDGAYSCNVIEHIEDDVQALKSIGLLLKPGARLGLFVPGGGDFLYGTLDSLDRHFRRYTKARLRTRLEAAGYEVISIRHVNFAGFFLWFLKGRIFRSKHIRPGEVKSFDKMVPALRIIDRLTGPFVGQSLAVVAKWKGCPESDAARS